MITKQKRAQVKQWTDALGKIAKKAPDQRLQAQVNRVINAARMTYALTLEQKRAEVLRAITLGASEVAQIVEETMLSQPDVQELVRDLERSGSIRRINMSLNSQGPRTACYFPVDR